MNKEIVQKLHSKVKEVATVFSNPERSLNFNKEIFSVDKIIPLSEFSAVVKYRKIPSEKLALVFFVYINGGEGFWMYFFPSDSHVRGMELVGKYLQEVEIENFNKN
jgi:hypothetical protein